MGQWVADVYLESRSNHDIMLTLTFAADANLKFNITECTIITLYINRTPNII